MKNDKDCDTNYGVLALAALTIALSVAATAAIVLWTPVSTGIPDLTLALLTAR